MTIPDWDAMGVLPPFDPQDPTTRQGRSPFDATMVELVGRYATSPERIEILRGLLAFRASLHRLGYVVGFQWIDGSFSEDIERIEGRAPRDVDVVSFVGELGVPQNPSEDDEEALDHDKAKERFRVDGYFVELDAVPPSMLVEQAAYWHGIWSHRRTERWKGFLRIDLDPQHDATASVALDACVAKLTEEA